MPYVIRIDGRARTGLLLGAVAQFIALAVAFMGSLVIGVFAPFALGQALIELMPGWLSAPLIEQLQFWAQRLLVIGVIVLFVITGAIAGALAIDPAVRTRTVVLAGAAPWAGAALLSMIFASSQVQPVAAIAGAGLGLAGFFGLLSLLAEGANDPLLTAPASPDRRRALMGAMAVGIVAALGGLASARPLSALSGAAERVKQTARRLVHSEPPAAASDLDSIPGLTPRLTPIDVHYTVDTALIDPLVDVADWRLEIGGAVAQPFALSYEELLELPAVEQLHTLECIDNKIGGDLIGTTLWTGVPLRDLLDRARPESGALDVVFRSVDGYSDSVRFTKAMEPKTILAYLMDGYRLPKEHGFPVRLLIPNIYGMKNVKWVARIEVVKHDYLGYWMERGWSDLAVVNTHSRIDTRSRLTWTGGAVTVAGIANAGSRGISRVEVSTDDGATWREAELETPLGPLTWRRWRLLWTPDRVGPHSVLVRATDGEGQTQTATERGAFPSGSTGYHRVQVDVVRA